MRLFLVFLIVPLIEIALFIQVGGFLGLLPTLAIVILTAIAGTIMVRSQGLSTLNALRSSMNNLSDPTEPLAHGAMILFSGALLLTPGFFTDAVGFALLIPGVRAAIVRAVRSRITLVTPQGARPARDDTIIDADYEDLDAPESEKPSGWTQH